MFCVYLLLLLLLLLLRLLLLLSLLSRAMLQGLQTGCEAVLNLRSDSAESAAQAEYDVSPLVVSEHHYFSMQKHGIEAFFLFFLKSALKSQAVNRHLAYCLIQLVQKYNSSYTWLAANTRFWVQIEA